MDFDLITQIIPFFVYAGWTTIQLTILTLMIGLPVAFIVSALRSSKSIICSALAAFYISIMRGTPLLIQIFLVYYGAFAFGFDTTPFVSATLTMGFNIGAYMSEGIRGSFNSIDKGQYEAARALGFGKIRTLFYFILPQAAAVMIRTIETNTVILTKSTALASTIGVVELTYTAQRFVTSNTAKSFEIFGLAAIYYLIILSAILLLFKMLSSSFNGTKLRGLG